MTVKITGAGVVTGVVQQDNVAIAVPAFSAYRSAAQQIGPSTTTILCDTEEYDYGGGHFNGVFTAPVPGVYMFFAGCGNSTSVCIMNQRFLKISGVVNTIYPGTYVASNVNSVSMSIQLLLAVGDTVQYQVSQSVSQSIATGISGNYFQGILVRPAA